MGFDSQIILLVYILIIIQLKCAFSKLMSTLNG